jgi:hypothetical protein
MVISQAGAAPTTPAAPLVITVCPEAAPVKPKATRPTPSNARMKFFIFIYSPLIPSALMIRNYHLYPMIPLVPGSSMSGNYLREIMKTLFNIRDYCIFLVS